MTDHLAGARHKLINSMATKNKMEKTMGEYGAGELHSGSKKGPVVTDRKQAIAIGISQASKAAKAGR